MVSFRTAAPPLSQRRQGCARRSEYCGAASVVFAKDVGYAAATAFQELAALNHQYIAVLSQQDARRQALVLSQPGRSAVGEADPAGNLVVDDLRRHRRPAGLRSALPPTWISATMPMARSSA